MAGHSTIKFSPILWVGMASVLAVGLAACAGGGSHPETSPAELGRDYARDACAACHAVEIGKALSPNVAAPSFETLANRSDMSRAALAALLRSPHRNMPSLIVEPDRIDDLAAYLYVLGDGE